MTAKSKTPLILVGTNLEGKEENMKKPALKGKCCVLTKNGLITKYNKDSKDAYGADILKDYHEVKLKVPLKMAPATASLNEEYLKTSQISKRVATLSQS
jgi:hypothetical protein